MKYDEGNPLLQSECYLLIRSSNRTSMYCVLNRDLRGLSDKDPQKAVANLVVLGLGWSQALKAPHLAPLQIRHSKSSKRCF